MSHRAFSQQKLTGTVTNESAEPLAAASVNLVNDKSVIFSYAITNRQGAYSLTTPVADTANKFWMEVSHVGYKKQRVAVAAGIAEYNFILIADTGTLKGVTVQNRPLIQSMGDTIRYNVNSFARKEDRTIGDVLRRMPGIIVDEDGTIYFNGKMVENLYIHGDDLMDGRYGLAPKVIRKELVSDVDVVRNHQPLQVLKEKEFSDKTIINLVLKDDKSFKLSAKGMAGGGLPEQYDLSFTPLLLNQRIKTLNKLAVNNSGVDYQNEFKQLGSSGLVANLAEEAPRPELSLATAGTPDVALVDYYLNSSGIINLNNLYKTKKALQLRSNFQFYYDKTHLNYFSQADNYIAGDTISFRETQAFTNKPQLFIGALTATANRDRYFFNNSFRVNLACQKDYSVMSFNDNSFSQQLYKKIREFSNDLTWIPALRGKNIGEIRWLISYSNHHQQLDIGKGYFADIKNYEDYYDHVWQDVRSPSLFSHVSLSWRKPGKVVNQQYKAGFISQSQTLESDLSFQKDGNTISYAGDPGNNLDWDRHSVYLTEEYQLRYNKLRATLQLPLTFQRIIYRQQEYSLPSANRQLIFTPDIFLRYDLTNEQSITAKLSRSNTFGNITNVYRGAILQTYRLLQANNATLQERVSYAVSVNYEYQHTVTMLFLNTGVTWNRTQQNTLLSAEVSDNIQRFILLPYKNNIITTGLTNTVSKYLFGLKTTVTVKSSLNFYRFMRLLNDELFPFNSHSLSLNGNLIKKLFGSVNLTYQPSFFWISSKVDSKPASGNSFSSRAFRAEQQLTVNMPLAKKLLVEISGRHNYSIQTGNNSVQYFFMDTKCRFTGAGKKMDLSLDITNIFNIKKYTRYSLLANQLIQDQYTLRGRMVMLRMDYLF
ncbi:MAG: TonB-dependent receptor [Chitinophagaceae bacterium]|nr:TonB-dependent receptor [Chitinophagaceae bacterium]